MSISPVPVFSIVRHIAALPQPVWEAWADPVKMARWSGPKGSTVQILQGELAVGQTTISRTASPEGPEMFSLCRWLELTPPHRVVWEQSFCTREGIKCSPPFFDDWPQTLLTEVTLVPRHGGTDLKLTWTPVEYSEAALAMFAVQMDSMRGGWGGSLDKLQEWLSGNADSCQR
jgi:uncharacterized protein YndB with AHSA1/START domain